MEIAYCLVSAFYDEHNPVEHIAKEIGKHKEVIEVNYVFGEYDFILKLGDTSMINLGEFVQYTLRQIHGVIDTKTLLVPTELDKEYQEEFRKARGQNPRKHLKP
jgi:DNA-binding Lrp family transcriptional regulator